MKSLTRILVVLLCGAGAGCIVEYDEPPPHHRVIYRERVVTTYSSPEGSEVPVESAEEVEVNDVVYREYYGCSDEEIVLLPHYRRYYALTDDDIYFIYFVSRRSNVSFDVCFHSYYYDCGRSYDRLVVTYNVPREHFFVAVGPGVSYPPVYARTYASYHNGTYASVTFTNAEYGALVRMRVACDYQGHPPTTYFARVQATGSPSRVIVESRDQCGRGGHTASGATVSVHATRAWTLPPDQKQQWHQNHQQATVRSESNFKDRHPEQVQKVQAQEKKAPPRPAAGGHPPSRGAAPQHPQNGAPPPTSNGSKPGHEEHAAEKHGPEPHHPPGENKGKPPPAEQEKKGEKDREK